MVGRDPSGMKTLAPLNGLNLLALRMANRKRGPKFRNRKGQLVDCSKWLLSQWSNATLGELGELANIIKKIEVGDMTLAEAHPLIRREFADIQTYLDIYAAACGVDLGSATIEKFNEVSERCKTSIRLAHDGITE